MNIMMIRHPVTKANIEGLVQHNIEGELEMRGYDQIIKLIKRLEYEEVDGLYSSDAYRCRVLTERIAQSKGIIVTYDALFREIDNGNWAGKKKAEIERLTLEDAENFRPPNGESLVDLAKRAEEGFQLIMGSGKNRCILVSHGWFLKIFLGNQLGLKPLTAIKELKFSNCAISEIRLTKDGCMIEYLNNRDYLKC